MQYRIIQKVSGRISMGVTLSLLLISISMGPHYAMAGPAKPGIKETVQGHGGGHDEAAPFSIIDLQSKPPSENIDVDGQTYRLETDLSKFMLGVGRYMCEVKKDTRCGVAPTDLPRSDRTERVYDDYNRHNQLPVAKDSPYKKFLSKQKSDAERLQDAGNPNTYKSFVKSMEKMKPGDEKNKAVQLQFDQPEVMQAGFVPLSFIDFTALKWVGDGFAAGFNQTFDHGFLHFLEEIWVAAALGAAVPVGLSLIALFGFTVPVLPTLTITTLLICISILLVSVAIGFFVWKVWGKGKHATLAQSYFQIGYLLFINLRSMLVSLITSGGMTFLMKQFAKVLSTIASVLGNAARAFELMIARLQAMSLEIAGVEANASGTMLFRRGAASVPPKSPGWSGNYVAPTPAPPVVPPPGPLQISHLLSMASATIPPFDDPIDLDLSPTQVAKKLQSAPSVVKNEGSPPEWGDPISDEQRALIEKLLQEMEQASRVRTDQQLLRDVMSAKPLDRRHFELLLSLARGEDWLANWAYMKILELLTLGNFWDFLDQVSENLFTNTGRLRPRLRLIGASGDDELSMRARREFIRLLSDQEQKRLKKMLKSAESMNPADLILPSNILEWILVYWFVQDDQLLDQKLYEDYVDNVMASLIAGEIPKDYPYYMALFFYIRYMPDGPFIKEIDRLWIVANTVEIFKLLQNTTLVTEQDFSQFLDHEMTPDSLEAMLDKLRSEYSISITDEDKKVLAWMFALLTENHYVQELAEGTYGLAASILAEHSFVHTAFGFTICLIFTQDRQPWIGIVTPGGQRRVLHPREMAYYRRMYNPNNPNEANIGFYLLLRSMPYTPLVHGEMYTLRNDGNIRPWVLPQE